ncbi:type 1 glutamine amidotransferase domain-containing protein [Cohnella sp. JJ-181]|uniref:type 1 glutamine amidotransferase domain-containing protein n=1 Tax=Cohnella rhizoplanae TaxID=2974897 RepID=UPI0022FFB426|nr:type 1 glutamine amidotransferase domain-containing protein [Cohnella sp. JJ-181]CAI6030248.1 Protein/nucleic acid deglycase HchA [Cohnella sp. JJ-181]
MQKTNQVLIVVTNGKQLDGGVLAGVWWSEVAEPIEAFAARGYEVTIASPKGGEALVDPASMKDAGESAEHSYRKWLSDTMPLRKAKTQDYQAIFLAGGHGAMFDFPQDVHLQNLLTDFVTAGKPIGAVCHGVAGLVGAKLDTSNPLVENKTLTGFTNAEEAQTPLQGRLPFLLETKLKELEAKFVAGPDYAEHVEVDGGLVTGQNPASSRAAAIAVADLIAAGKPLEHRQGRVPGGVGQ